MFRRLQFLISVSGSVSPETCIFAHMYVCLCVSSALCIY